MSEQVVRHALAAAFGDDLSPEQVAWLAGRAETLRLAPEQVLIKTGTPADLLLFLADGQLRVELEAGDGDVLLGRVQPGHLVGEVGFIDGQVACATLTADAPCTLLALSHDALDGIADERPVIASILMRAVARELAARVERTGAGLVEKVGEGDFELQSPEVQRTWFSRALAKLVGGAQ